MSELRICYQHPTQDQKKLTKALAAFYVDLLLEEIDQLDLPEGKKSDAAVACANLLSQNSKRRET